MATTETTFTKIDAKEMAIREVKKRIVTKEIAKANFISWIDYALKYESVLLDSETIEFWKEVREETLKL